MTTSSAVYDDRSTLVEALGQPRLDVVDRHHDAEQRPRAARRPPRLRAPPPEPHAPQPSEPRRRATPTPGRLFALATVGSAPVNAAPPPSDRAAAPRTVLFVAGAGRTGTSTFAGLMQLLGLHVPQPEVPADDSNPKGFAEPQWVVDFHDRLLADAMVTVSDSRARRVVRDRPDRHPRAGADRRRRVARGPLGRPPGAGGQGPAARLVPRPVAGRRDPRRRHARRSPPCCARRRRSWAASRSTTATGSARLISPRRGSTCCSTSSAPPARTSPTAAASSSATPTCSTTGPASPWTRRGAWTCSRSSTPTASRLRDVHRFIDPSLRRVTVSLDELGLPRRLHDLTEQTWEQLNLLAEPDGDTPEVHAALDQLRDAYVELYEESEAISRSSVEVAKTELKRRLRAQEPADAGLGGRQDPPRPAREDPVGRAHGAPYAARSVTAQRSTGLRTSRATPTSTSSGRGQSGGPQRPGTTAVLRVKNEAPSLPFVLPPLLRACDEVLLVDNGSTDGTLEVAAGDRRAVGPCRDASGPTSTPSTSRAPAPSTSRQHERSVHSLAYFYNWCFAQVRTRYSWKWDGDMVLTTEGEVSLADSRLAGRHDQDVIVRVPRHGLYLESDRRGYLDLGLRNAEEWGFPMTPGLRLHQGVRVGDPDDARAGAIHRAAAGPVRGAEVPRRRRVRPLDRPRVVRHQPPQPSQAPRVGGLQRTP